VFLGYVGYGLLDGVAVGNVFSSPSSAQIATATRAVDGGAGVLYLYGNYGGDIYNFDIAADLVAVDGIRTATVLAADDVASAPSESSASRRGVAGMVYAFKIAGAAAERGDDLDSVTSIARKVGDNTRTMGVGPSPTILPAAGEPTFTLAEGEMELGIGIHGEPGTGRTPLLPADVIADRLLDAILDDLPPLTGETVSVLVNGMGATPLEELYLLYRRVAGRLAALDVTIPPPARRQLRHESRNGGSIDFPSRARRAIARATGRSRGIAVLPARRWAASGCRVNRIGGRPSRVDPRNRTGGQGDSTRIRARRCARPPSAA